MDDKKQVGNIPTPKTSGSGDKPSVMRVTLPGGKVRLLNVTQAAVWLGCSRQCLSQMAHGTAKYVSAGLIERAKNEFPELFKP